MTTDIFNKLTPGTKVFTLDNWQEPDSLKTGLTVILDDRGSQDYIRLSDMQLHHRAFVFPETPEILEDAKRILTKRAALKKELDDSMSWVYQFMNKVTRGEYPQK